MAAEIERLAALLPPAAIDLATAWRPLATDRATVLRELLLPLLVEPDWPGPANPLAVGDGWVQPDLTEDDLDTFDRLRQLLAETEPNVGPERLAIAAQEWRLPVLPYRPLPPSNTLDPLKHPELAPGSGVIPTLPGASSELGGVRVLDLSSLWAGPLCTSLLAAAGATVVKVDPDCRPDGFRERPNLYAELNGGKSIVSLDLRTQPDRSEFERLVASSDLLVESFSRRVLPNLGYDNRALSQLSPTLVRVSIVGFANNTAEADWLTYGSGIHAISGLGMLGSRAEASAVAYPDPLTGYRAATIASEAVMSAKFEGQIGVNHLEVALADTGHAVAERTQTKVRQGACQ